MIILGGFLPKDHIKDDFYYEPYVTTAFPMEKTTEDYIAKIPINTTASTFGGKYMLIYSQ